MKRAGLVLIASWLVLAAPAGASASEFLLTSAGSHPDVTVDASGTGHFAWTETNGSGDITHYCQVPRGASACTVQQTFPAPVQGNTDFDGPRVMLGSTAGQVLVLTESCCNPVDTPDGQKADDSLWLYTSSDGGKTFGPAQLIAANDGTAGIPAGGAILGPGAFAISGVSDNGWFKSFPIGGFSREQVRLGTPTCCDYDASLGLVDASTPIFADRNLDTQNTSTVEFRLWHGGSSDYNDPAGWGPLESLGVGDDPRLASGPRGTYLMERTGAPGSQTYVVRKFAGGTFGQPAAISETGDPIERDFSEDQAGGLNAIWDSGQRDLSYRYSTDGLRWSQTQVLVSHTLNQAIYHPRVSACAPGDGFAVWDQNAPNRPIDAVRLGSNPSCAVPAGGSGCATSVQFGQVKAVADSGCFTRKGSTYQTGGPVTVNGLQLGPAGGGASDAHAAGGPSITIDTSLHTLISTGAIAVRAGPITLAHVKLSWLLPPNGGDILEADGSGNPISLDTGGLGQHLLSLPIVGQVTPRLANGQVIVPVNLQLPPPIGSITGGALTFNDIELRVGNGSIGINGQLGFHLHLDQVSLGIATIKPFDITYSNSDDTLSGDVGVQLPAAGKIRASILFQHGTFVDLAADYQPSPPIILAGAPPAAVFLSDINLHAHKLTDCAHPTEIAGGIGLTGGPPVLGKGIVGITGTASYKFPEVTCNLPGVFRLDGSGTIGGIPIANAYIQYETNGKLTLGGGASLNAQNSGESASVKLDVNGGIDFNDDSFFLEGTAGAGLEDSKQLIGVDAIISSIGVGACGTVLGIGGGFEYQWGAVPVFLFPACDVSALKPSAFSSSLHGHVSTAGFRVSPHAPFEDVVVTGSSAPPAVILSGPGGERIVTPASGQDVVTSTYAVASVPATRRTVIKLVHPAAGTWTLSPQPGSPAVSTVASADPLPAPQVRAHVRKLRGDRFDLAYRVRPIPGQRVSFVERSGASAHSITTTGKTAGTIRFTPSAGPGGRRTILAVVEQRGLPRARLVVATYSVPAPTLPSRPTDLRVRRARSVLVITWRAVHNAARYVVSVRLRDGRQLERIVSRRIVRIGGVPGIDSARVLVGGLSADNRLGALAAARLAAHPRPPCSERGKLPPRCRRHRRGRRL